MTDELSGECFRCGVVCGADEGSLIVCGGSVDWGVCCFGLNSEESFMEIECMFLSLRIPETLGSFQFLVMR